MNTDASTFTQPTGPRPPDRREVLWNELERLHPQLGIDPPTVSYTRTDLAEEVILARRARVSTTNASHPLKVDTTFQRAAHQAGAVLEGAFGQRILENAAHRP